MKKRMILLLLAAALLILCCACDRDEPEVIEPEVNEPEVVKPEPLKEFPADSVICGLNVSGLRPAAAEAMVAEYVNRYVLAMNLDGLKVSFTAEELGLNVGKVDFQALLEQCEEDKGVVLSAEDIVTYDLKTAETKLAELSAQMEPARNATIHFSEDEDGFLLEPEGTKGQIDVTVVLDAAAAAVSKLEMNLRMSAEGLYLPAEITADSEAAQEALRRANEMLGVTLTYSFKPRDKVLGTEVIDREQIRTWLEVQEDGLTVDINPGPVNDFVSAMYEAYSISNSTSKFKTTKGEEIEIRVPSPGETVDSDALYNGIFENVSNGTSGEYEAPYVEDADFSEDFGGNYVEIDLSAQHLWVYNNGKCVVDTDIVTGCVNTGNATPAGVYTIKSKETDRYLVGPGYKSWVNYWMPFNGGIGLHDADGWRWSYGGSIYLYNGSHGCINMPRSAAKATYQNISVGTYVILYGGAKSVAPLKQSLQGTRAYNVKEGDGSFKLDAAPTYKTELIYTSDNAKVAKVAADGTVTIVGPGKATITITAKEKPGYTSATMTVTITVNSKCSLGEHQWDSGAITTAATCNVEGVKTYTCKECGETKTEAIPKTSHTPDSGTVTTQPTCGAEGVKTFCCTVCGTSLKTEPVAATGNHESDEGKVTTAPTCSAAGTKTYSCKHCGKVLNTEAIPVDPNAHHYENGACTGCGAQDPAAPKPDPEPEPDPEPDPGTGTGTDD